MYVRWYRTRAKFCILRSNFSKIKIWTLAKPNICRYIQRMALQFFTMWEKKGRNKMTNYNIDKHKSFVSATNKMEAMCAMVSKFKYRRNGNIRRKVSEKRKAELDNLCILKSFIKVSKDSFSRVSIWVEQMQWKSNVCWQTSTANIITTHEPHPNTSPKKIVDKHCSRQSWRFKIVIISDQVCGIQWKMCANENIHSFLQLSRQTLRSSCAFETLKWYM